MTKRNSSKKESISKRFARNLEEALKERKTTRNKLKEKTGVNLARYKDSDDIREPSLSSAVMIADALNMSLDELCGRSKYVSNIDSWNAGEVLSVLTYLVENCLCGSFNSDGTKIDLPESNVTEAIGDRNQYHDKYAQAKDILPEKFNEDAITASDKWLEKKIKELKESGTKVELSQGAQNSEYRYSRMIISQLEGFEEWEEFEDEG